MVGMRARGLERSPSSARLVKTRAAVRRPPPPPPVRVPTVAKATKVPTQTKEGRLMTRNCARAPELRAADGGHFFVAHRPHLLRRLALPRHHFHSRAGALPEEMNEWMNGWMNE